MSATYKRIEGDKWQWGESYVFALATYVVSCPPGRRCQVGMGIFVLSEPLGKKLEFSGDLEVTVLGAGALHFRVVDGMGPCQVAFALKRKRPISWSWPTG